MLREASEEMESDSCIEGFLDVPDVLILVSLSLRCIISILNPKKLQAIKKDFKYAPKGLKQNEFNEVMIKNLPEIPDQTQS